MGVKRRFNLIAAQEDLVKRQQIFGATKGTLDGMYGKLQADYTMMTQTLPEEKKDFVKKEINAVTDKLEVLARFKEKVDSIKKCVAAEAVLLPQGDTVPQDAQDYKTELKRIQDYVIDLHKRVMATCDSFSEDVKFWAEYKTG